MPSLTQILKYKGESHSSSIAKLGKSLKERFKSKAFSEVDIEHCLRLTAGMNFRKMTTMQDIIETLLDDGIIEKTETGKYRNAR